MRPTSSGGNGPQHSTTVWMGWTIARRAISSSSDSGSGVRHVNADWDMAPTRPRSWPCDEARASKPPALRLSAETLSALAPRHQGLCQSRTRTGCGPKARLKEPGAGLVAGRCP
eukprot:4356392-Alexandrium_andersonii.AAC.1